ncbi:MAG: chromosomal replication initiator protein DnaA [Candidatus Pacebacteria bacterium]|nr:chromosomal replication initiator protein DnaA [Candidatus Paceibacterota bacterium]
MNPSIDNKKIWEEVLNSLELELSKANFNTWFKDTHILKYESGIIFIGVPNEFVKNWLYEKYNKYIIKILRGLENNIRAVEYIIDNSQIKNKAADKQYLNINNKLPLEETVSINKNDNLNPRYTFNNFIVGTFNELSYVASQTVLKKQGVVYNPLFIYGKTGYGKTHLIQALGNEFKKLNKKVFYTTSEKFYTDCIQSIQQNKINLFKEKYRKYDILIMDDIQFLTHKERTQEELFHLFNYLYDNNKQIIFSSDRHPNHIPDIADRLKSRFSAGMTVDIQVPDIESRTAIIKSKIKMNNFYLEDIIVNYIALEVKGNIRELEGIFNSIMCQSQLKKKELSLQEIRNLIKININSNKNISIKEIIKTVANFYNIEEEMICKKTRKKEIVKPRQLIMYILREDFNISYPSIGEKLGGRDHTTVIHSCDKIRNNLKNNSLLIQELEQIRSMFG